MIAARFRPAWWLPIAALTLAGCKTSAGGTGPRPDAAPPRSEPSVRPGINEPYQQQVVIDDWLGRFEVESREIYRERERIAAAAGVGPGLSVADIGAGTGFFSILFAGKVGPRGKVYAVDIVPEFIGHIRKRAAEAGLDNVVGVVCREDSVDLPDASIDLAFVCDTYHHFEYPHNTLASIHRALRPGGTLVIVDFKRIVGVSRDWVLEHVRAGQDVVTREVTDAGFQLIDDGSAVTCLEENYLIRFRRLE